MRRVLAVLTLVALVVGLVVVAPAYRPSVHAGNVVTIKLPVDPASDGKYYAYVNGEKKVLDAPPFIYQGRTMVPARFVTEAFGAEVNWNAEAREATFKLKYGEDYVQIRAKDEGGKIVDVKGIGQVKLYSDKVYVKNTFISDNEVEVILDVPVANPVKIGRIYLPIRFVSETFGASVQWDAKNRQVIISWDKSSIENPIEVTFWHAMRASLGAALKDLINEFNITHPYILISEQPQPNYGTLSQKLLAAISDGNPPVMAQAYENWVDDYAKGGILEEMGKYINGEVPGVDPLYKMDREDIFPIFWKDTFMPDGKQYMMPFNKSLRVLYVNKDALTKIGKDVPITWEELAEDSKLITEATGGQMQGISIYLGPELWYAMVHAFGGKVFSDDLTEVLYPDYPEAWAKPFAFFKNLIDEGYAHIAPPHYGDQKDFSSQKTMFYIGTTAGLTYVHRGVKGAFTYDIYPLPGGYMTVEGTNLVMFKGKNITEDQKKAAWTFIRWLTSTIPQAKWSAATGYFPIRKSTWDSDLYKKLLEEKFNEDGIPYQWRFRFEPVFEGKGNVHLLITPPSAAWGKARRDVSNYASQVLKGEISPDEAAQAIYNKILTYMAEGQ